MSGLFNSAGAVSGIGLGGADDSFASMAGSGAANGASASVPFAGVLQTMVQQTGALDQQASQAVTGVMNGQGVDIHDAMIATQKADMAFQLALEVRNKAVGAYQQMMGMQF